MSPFVPFLGCESVLKLQFWKPFTTWLRSSSVFLRCESVLKLQFWKPFTTPLHLLPYRAEVWISPEITILKAIHNVKSSICSKASVWISPEITILKAIHNKVGNVIPSIWGVNQSWNYNFESHSQPKLTRSPSSVGVNQSWNYNFESHSQQKFWASKLVCGCESVLKLQFWKPFTTNGQNAVAVGLVWISPEITILKAIHNGMYLKTDKLCGVNQSWNYNFESHSQQLVRKQLGIDRCESVLKLQFWKPFTTGIDQFVYHIGVWISPEITILKAIHNTVGNVIPSIWVWISPEITILKAIHNLAMFDERWANGVNQSWNYNFESHSQLGSLVGSRCLRCESVLKLQFWKPFTTVRSACGV